MENPEKSEERSGDRGYEEWNEERKRKANFMIEYFYVSIKASILRDLKSKNIDYEIRYEVEKSFDKIFKESFTSGTLDTSSSIM